MKHSTVLVPAALAALLAAGAALSLASCSTAGKRPMLVTDIHSKAARRYEEANAELAVENLEEAGVLLERAYHEATSIDNADLLCRICLSACIYKLSLRMAPDSVGTEAFAGQTADDLLDEAKMYAGWADDAELISVCKIYEAKGLLIQKQATRTTMLAQVESLQGAQKKISRNPFYKAYLFRTLGDLYTELEDYAAAAESYRKAAAIHTKHRYLDEIGIDWYYAARAHSRGGEKEKAVEAIFNALRYDRDAENIPAIISDYNAYAQIIVKGRTTDEERRLAALARERAEKIYAAAFQDIGDGEGEEEAGAAAATAGAAGE